MLACVIVTSCNIPRSVWETLEKRPEFHITSVSIEGPAEIQNGATAIYNVTVEFECQDTGVGKVIRELWDSDLPPVDPDELLSWRRDEVLCQPPPQITRDTKTLSLRCVQRDVWGFSTMDPNGNAITPNSGEGTSPWPLRPPAEIYARSQGTIGPARRSGEKHILCVEP